MAEVGKFISVKYESGITSEMVDEILKVRGWDDGDIWTVDQLNGDIRIIKSRNDSKIHAAGAGVEFWRWDPVKKLWYGLYTA